MPDTVIALYNEIDLKTREKLYCVNTSSTWGKDTFLPFYKLLTDNSIEKARGFW